MTTRRTFLGTGAALMGVGLTGCAGMGGGGWTTLVDGATMSMKDFDTWGKLGTGNWSITDGTLQGKGGNMGYLVTPGTYANFEIRAEFWADADCNSGIFIRCADPKKVGADNAYEVNIFDKRPDPTYGTGAIVDVAKVAQPGPKAADRWNVFEIKAQGDRFIVVLNGQQTVDVRDSKRASGPIALQSAGGTIRFRKVLIRSI